MCTLFLCSSTCVSYSCITSLFYLYPVISLAIMHFRCILKTWVLLLRHCIFIHMCLTIITFVGVIGTIYLLILFMQHIYICMQLSTISGIFMPYKCYLLHVSTCSIITGIHYFSCLCLISHRWITFLCTSIFHCVRHKISITFHWDIQYLVVYFPLNAQMWL